MDAAPETPEQLLNTIQELWGRLKVAPEAERPAIERQIRELADRYSLWIRQPAVRSG